MGAGLPAEAVAATVFVLAGNTLLRPLVNWVNRRPITQGTTAAQYRIHAICDRSHASDVRNLLDELLSRASHPIRKAEAMSESEDQGALAAILVRPRPIPPNRTRAGSTRSARP